MARDSDPLTRRAVLRAGALAATGLVAACTGTPEPSPATGPPAATASSGTAAASGTSSRASPSPSSSPSSSPSPSSAATTSHPTSPALPTPSAWRPSAGDVQPAVKQAAVDVVTALLAYPPGGAGPKAAADRVRAAGQNPALVGTVPGLVGTGGTADTATVGIVDVQYGGILRTSASVLVVCRQWTLTGSTVTSGGTTVDVRLVAATPKWRVTELHPSQPGAEVPRLSAAAGQVLASSRIDLPPASRADILSGQVHDSVLGTMLGLAQTYTLAVSVVRSGHPILVFGTSRPSDHPKGRAFDTWAIDGHPVVEPATPRSLVTGYMSRAAALGSYNVGGPYLLPGSAFFSDDTHHDHVHIGFTA